MSKVSADRPGNLESPFLDQELFVASGDPKSERRVAALAAESPFQSAFEKGWGPFDLAEMEESGLSRLADPAAEHDELSGAEWSPEASELTEDFTGAAYGDDEVELLRERTLEERFDPSAIPADVADALGKKDWPRALELAIQAGWRDENELTNLIFFARHPELPPEKIDPKAPKFKLLSSEWSGVLDREVWKAIETSATNTALVVSGEEVADHHRRFFQGRSGKRLKKLIEDAAHEVDLNPGLLGTIMMAETRRPQSYLSSEKVSSYHIGVDDFYEARAAIQARVPAYKKIKWDKKQKPFEHLNDAKTNRRVVKTILFDSGPDAALATAVYVKFREVRIREIAAELKGDFDKLPLATQFALTRMAMAAGTGGVTPFLKDALKGVDIFVRKAIPVEAYQTRRNATVRSAQAMHLSDWVFGIRVPPASQPKKSEEAEEFEDHRVEPGADNYEGEVGFEHPAPEFRVGSAEQELEALEAREDRDASEEETPVIIQHDVPKTSTGPRFIAANVEGKASSGHQLFDAFYADERNTIMSRELHPFKCFWSMFTGFNNFRGFDKGYEYTDAVAITWWKDFPNPLRDAKLANILPENSASLPWKDPDTIEAFEGETRYYIYIPPGLSDDFKSRPRSDKPKAKISLFFGVWTEINSFGLRTYFSKSSDSVLITITSSLWGIGITTQMIRELLDVAGLKDIEFSVEVMAGYSAAYRSLNETVINKLVDLKKLKRLIYLDAFYYHDDFPLAKEGRQFQILDKNTSKPKNTNTLWAIDTVLKESADAALFIYAYSYAGTERTTKRFKKGAPPPRPGVPVDDFMKQRFPKRVMHFIDLEFDPRVRDDKVHKFESICLARLIQSGIDESFERKNVPANILALVDLLPDRGSLGTWGRTGFLDLFAWVVAGPQKDAIMRFPADQAFELVARFNLLGGWTPRRAAGPGPEDKKGLVAYGVPERLVRGYWLRHVDFVQEICKECLLP